MTTADISISRLTLEHFYTAELFKEPRLKERRNFITPCRRYGWKDFGRVKIPLSYIMRRINFIFISKPNGYLFSNQVSKAKDIFKTYVNHVIKTFIAIYQVIYIYIRRRNSLKCL